MDYDATRLVKWLVTKNPPYAAALVALRRAATEWLGYSLNLFPHFTPHTVSHSDEMVVQLSMMLFPDKPKSKPVLNLNATEAYVLLSAIYLHDSGMVVSPNEAAGMLTSDAWKAWTTGTGGGADRYASIQAAKCGTEPANKLLRDFLADVQLRYLLAEFVRQSHAERSSRFVSAGTGMWKPYLLHDPMVVDAVARLCAAHGLKHHELDDDELYPDDCAIQGERVNLRLLAILLRIADLLDFRVPRACPWLMNAACPIPADSKPHWEAFTRISMPSISPRRIRLRAKCLTQAEHRVLLDWCQWLSQETAHARYLVARMSRHSDWKPPIAETDGPNATIRIAPAPEATYIFREWRLEMDPDEIMRRLTHQLYSKPLAFVRELIQNALDATRTQMYFDMQKKRMKLPASPSDAPASMRRKYPVVVALDCREATSDESVTKQYAQFISVEDCGTGMDEDIIMKYFLQVGRSFYTTDEYRRVCSFAPTSRFGVGFLSVFGVGDHVTVETLRAAGPTSAPLKLTLTGPRNYLLVEKGVRASSGTRVEVKLNQQLNPGELTTFIKNMCRHVEFPIVVNDLGARTTAEAERPSDFTYETPVVGRPGTTFAVVSHPVRARGYVGDVYWLVYRDSKGEDWTQDRWARHVYPDSHVRAEVPRLPHDLTSLHGIALHGGNLNDLWGIGFRHRLDYRGRLPIVGVSREDRSPDASFVLQPVWARLAKRHLSSTKLARGQDGWKYAQRLLVGRNAPFRTLARNFAENYPGTIMAYRAGRGVHVSLAELLEAEPLITCQGASNLRRLGASRWPGLMVTPSQWEDMDDDDIQSLCFGRTLREVIVKDKARVGFWTHSVVARETALRSAHTRYYLVDLPEGIAALRLGGAFHGLMYAIAVARETALGHWLGRLWDAEAAGTWAGAAGYLPKLDRHMKEAMTSYERNGLCNLNTFLLQSSSAPALPPSLRPSGIVLTPESLPDCHAQTRAYAAHAYRHASFLKRRRGGRARKEN